MDLGLEPGLGLGSIQCIILIEIAVNQKKAKDGQFVGGFTPPKSTPLSKTHYKTQENIENLKRRVRQILEMPSCQIVLANSSKWPNPLKSFPFIESSPFLPAWCLLPGVFYLFISVSFSVSVSISVCLTSYLSFLFHCLYVCLAVWLFSCLYVCLSVCLFTLLSVCLLFCLSVCLSV